MLQSLSSEAAQFLRDPYVQLCAWKKLSRIYQARWLRDPRQWPKWFADPWPQMNAVADALITGNIDSLDLQLPLVPYPKERGGIRHFVRPTLEAEYASLLIGVLLCPLLDARMWSFSFGGRWHSGVARLPDPDANETGYLYRNLPFSLHDDQLLTSYRRSYGLFRRVAHWTTLTMLGEDPNNYNSEEPRQTPSEYPASSLPYLVDRSRLGVEPADALWYARMDIASAYPCVRRSVLRERLLLMLTAPLADVRGQMRRAWGITNDDSSDSWPYPFRPRDIWTQLEAKGSVRVELGDRWMDLLDAMIYSDPAQVDVHWRPSWNSAAWPLLPGIGPSSEGIPTGLSVAGTWFNVYLQPLDDALVGTMGLFDAPKISGVYFRYVDDMLFVGNSQERTLDLFGAALSWLQESSETTNLKPSHHKIKPELLRRAVEPGGNPNNQSDPIARSSWRADATTAWAARPCIERVDPNSLGPFVTTLVEQMSDLGNPGMLEIWGREVGPRLQELHRLVRVETEDHEVRTDTRLAFAGRRLAVAPLPEGIAAGENGGLSPALTQVKRSVKLAFKSAPWKVALLDAIVRLAVRIAVEFPEQAVEWLREIGSELSPDGPLATAGRWGPCGADSLEWTEPTPEERVKTAAGASFLRAQLFHALATVSRDLCHVVARNRIGEVSWGPEHWTAPLMSLASVSNVILPQLRPFFNQLNLTLGSGRVRSDYFWENDGRHDAFWAVCSPKIAVGRCTGQEAIARLESAADDPQQRLAELRRCLSGDPIKLLLWAHRLGGTDRLEVEDVEATWAFGDQTIDAAHPATLEGYALVRRLGLALGYRGWTLLDRTLPEQLQQQSAEGLNESVDLLDLLWSRPNEAVADPANVPAMGLPPRLVADLIRMSHVATPHIDRLPSGFRLTGALAMKIRAIRHWQISDDSAPAPAWQRPLARRTSASGVETPPPPAWPSQSRVPLHPLYVAFEMQNELLSATGFTPAPVAGPLLVGLVAVAGDETPLDLLLTCFPEPPNRKVLQALQDRYPLPKWFWNALRKALTVNESDGDGSDAIPTLNTGSSNLPAASPMDDLSYLLVDDEDVAILTPADAPRKTMTVRLAQLKREAWGNNHKGVIDSWPQHPDPAGMLRSAASALPFRSHGDGRSSVPDLTVLPELFIPHDALSFLVATCRRYRIGLLTGTYWRPIPAAVSVGWSAQRWLSNEALLVMPVANGLNRGVTRTVRIRKPRPAASELGLAQALSMAKGSAWHFLRGNTFFRLIHPRWGEFTVGICSDILDPAPWALLRGKIHHMFFSAHNEDVDLFSAVTRTRAYEDYCNVVLVNTGQMGGSFAWSPEAGHQKEIARFQGERVEIIADVSLLIDSLDKAQRKQLDESVKKAGEDWVTKPINRHRKFKTPPPEYRRR